jgi:hypothetical protein
VLSGRGDRARKDTHEDDALLWDAGRVLVDVRVHRCCAQDEREQPVREHGCVQRRGAEAERDPHAVLVREHRDAADRRTHALGWANRRVARARRVVPATSARRRRAARERASEQRRGDDVVLEALGERLLALAVDPVRRHRGDEGLRSDQYKGNYPESTGLPGRRRR